MLCGDPPGTLETPVPGLVHETLGVAPRIRQDEAKAIGMGRQPVESGGCVKGLFKRFVVRAGKVECAPCVMFAVTRRCISLEDYVDWRAPRELALDDPGLILKCPERGH